jgi:catechol 2,3-dioxygenase-like lactoylglutathione lyase family enzyme
VRLHYILLNVSDLEAATAHYTRLLGSAQRSRSRVAFPVGPAHVLLQKTPEGSGPGVQRFSVLAVPRDANLPDALETLRRIAPRTEPAEIPSSAIFRDPDGFQVEVLVPQ